MTRLARRLATMCLVLAACKLEVVGELPPMEDEPSRTAPGYVLRPERHVVDEETSLVDAELRRQLSLLASDVLGGRRPGSEGATRTVAHLERSMQQIGLSPAGVGGGWRQPVVVRIRSTETAELTLPPRVDGAEAETLRHGEGIVLWRTEPGAGVWSESAMLVDAGFGIEADEVDHHDYARLDVRGKIVVVRAGIPTDAGFDPSSQEQYGTVEYKAALAGRKGALGCLVATGSLSNGSTWEELAARHGAPLLEDADEPDTDTTAIVGILSAEGEAQLRAWLAAGAKADAGAVPNAAPLVDLAVTTSERTIVDSSVVGRIAGSERPREVVVVVAHWDAGGTSAPLAEGGALTDNATGVAALLTVARRSQEWVRRGRTPARSIAFVATASDTLGMAGAKALLRDGPLSRAEIVAVVSLDSLGLRVGAPPLGAVDLAASELQPMLEAIRPSLRALSPADGPHVPGSHTPALEAGIAAVTLTQYDPSLASDETFEVGDVLTPLAQTVSFVFDAVWRIAESTTTPKVRPPNETDD